MPGSSNPAGRRQQGSAGAALQARSEDLCMAAGLNSWVLDSSSSAVGICGCQSLCSSGITRQPLHGCRTAQMSASQRRSGSRQAVATLLYTHAAQHDSSCSLPHGKGLKVRQLVHCTASGSRTGALCMCLCTHRALDEPTGACLRKWALYALPQSSNCGQPACLLLSVQSRCTASHTLVLASR